METPKDKAPPEAPLEAPPEAPPGSVICKAGIKANKGIELIQPKSTSAFLKTCVDTFLKLPNKTSAQYWHEQWLEK